MGLRRTGLRDAPNDVRGFFFFAINVHGNTRYSKNGIPDQTDRIYTLFQTKMAISIPYFRLEMLENDTSFGAAHTYMAYIWEYPPPPPGFSEPCGCMTKYLMTMTILFVAYAVSPWKMNTSYLNPFTIKFKNYVLPTFQKEMYKRWER